MSILRNKTTIGELMQLPNRISHYYFHKAYEMDLQSQKNPKGDESKYLQGEAMADQLTGVV